MKRVIAILLVLVLSCAMITCVSAAGLDSVKEIGGSILTTVLISVVIGVVLAFLIPMSILKGQLKTVSRQKTATSYVRPDSLLLKRQQDIYLFRNVVRTPLPKNNQKGK